MTLVTRLPVLALLLASLAAQAQSPSVGVGVGGVMKLACTGWLGLGAAATAGSR